MGHQHPLGGARTQLANDSSPPYGRACRYAFHVRTTFLPPAHQLEEVSRAIAEFHSAFLDEYASVHAQQMPQA